MRGNGAPKGVIGRTADSAAQLLCNPGVERDRPYGEAERAILSVAAGREALTTIKAWPGYAPTPLLSLEAMADETGVAAVLLKDESRRFELQSFKALGGAYAVERLARERGAGGLTVTCATDGNHGRAVAWGAKRVGARAVIFVHETVSQGRVDAIAAFGAKVIRVPGTYDDAVRHSAEVAAREGWQIVSDTSWPGYDDVPRHVMQGYAVLAAEILDFEPDLTHIFVPGGVGGLAAGVLSWLWELRGRERPVLVVVEPDRAACLFESAWQQKPTTFPGDLDTIMAGLACGEPSMLAWRILGRGADAFMTITDEAVARMMRDLAALGIVSGESGAAAIAGFSHAATDPAMREALCLGPHARVVCLSTEGATDPEIYATIVGRSADAVLEAARR
jgi:diaminopropionate ammonia-lyase